MPSIPQAQSRLGKAPNLDMHDKLVKRGQVVCWGGYRAQVQRVRMGRCLVKFVGPRGGLPTSADLASKWLSCSSVYVVPA